MKKLLSAFVFSFALIVLSGANSIEDEYLITMLRVTVLDSKGNPQKGAEVVLYHTEEQAHKNKHGIKAPKKTNDNGRVTFKKGLKPKSYYIVARKGNMHSESHLKTQRIEKGRINNINVIIDDDNHFHIPEVK